MSTHEENPGIHQLDAFRLIILSVIESFVHESWEKPISLAKLTEVINKDPYTSFVKLNMNSNYKDVDCDATITLKDVILSITTTFQSRDIHILKENKDTFILTLSREEFQNLVNFITKRYTENMTISIHKDEQIYSKLISEISSIQKGSLDHVIVQEFKNINSPQAQQELQSHLNTFSNIPPSNQNIPSSEFQRTTPPSLHAHNFTGQRPTDTPQSLSLSTTTASPPLSNNQNQTNTPLDSSSGTSISKQDAQPSAKSQNEMQGLQLPPHQDLTKVTTTQTNPSSPTQKVQQDSTNQQIQHQIHKHIQQQSSISTSSEKVSPLPTVSANQKESLDGQERPSTLRDDSASRIISSMIEEQEKHIAQGEAENLCTEENTESKTKDEKTSTTQIDGEKIEEIQEEKESTAVPTVVNVPDDDENEGSGTNKTLEEPSRKHKLEDEEILEAAQVKDDEEKEVSHQKEDEDEGLKEDTVEKEEVKREEPLTKKAKTDSTSESSPRNRKLQVIANPLIASISAYKYASAFLQPVNESSAPDYYSLIKQPRDLKTIKHMVKDGRLQNKDELERDILLMFANAIMYNKTGTDIYNWAKEMQFETDKLLKLFKEANNEST